MIKIQGNIPDSIIQRYENKPHGTRPTKLDEVPIDTKNCDNNRTPKATQLSERLESNDGFQWQLYGAPLVARLPDGSYKIIDGGNRVATLQRILTNETTFPALIIDVESESEIARLFHRINGTASATVSVDVRFISKVLGEEEGLDSYKRVMTATNIVVAENSKSDNYVLKDITVDPKWRINSKGLEYMTDKHEQYAIDALNLYTTSFGTGKEKLSPVVVQITKALQQIFISYEEFFTKEKNAKKEFNDWFNSAVSFKVQPKHWLYNEKYNHDRMEQRHLGTMLGIVTDWRQYMAANNRPAPLTSIAKNLYELHAVNKAKKLEELEAA